MLIITSLNDWQFNIKTHLGTLEVLVDKLCLYSFGCIIELFYYWWCYFHIIYARTQHWNFWHVHSFKYSNSWCNGKHIKKNSLNLFRRIYRRFCFYFSNKRWKFNKIYNNAKTSNHVINEDCILFGCGISKYFFFFVEVCCVRFISIFIKNFSIPYSHSYIQSKKGIQCWMRLNR